MTGFLKVIGLLTVVLHCNGFSARKQGGMRGNNDAVFRLKSGRRFQFPQGSVIIGAPSYPNHLPEAEAILPGHTLLRPGLGMLKSAVKFPHRELEGGSGVYGNWDNIGIRYDGKNERVLYSGFRRSNSNDPIVFFQYLPLEKRSHKTTTKKDKKNEYLSRIISDILNTEYRRNSKQKSSKKRFSKKTKETVSKSNKRTRQKNETDNKLSFLVKKGINLRDINQVIDNTLESWDLRELVKAKNKYIDKFLRTISSQRRYKNNDNIQNVKQYFKEKHEERLDKNFFDQHKDYFKEFKISHPKPNVQNDKEEESAFKTESEEINITPEDDTVTSIPKPKTREQRKQEWFWQTRDTGNHVKINQNALDFDEFLPKVPEDEDLEQIQSWWYYNQADHTKLQEKRRHD